MTLLAQSAYPGPLILSPVALLAVWAALNRTTNPVSISQILGLKVPVAPSFSKQVTGVFQDQTGAGISRTGFLIDRASGALITTFTSTAGTGAFTALAPNANPVIIVLVPNLGDSRNAIILDDITPV
jgi:hypothetical protein